MKPNPAPGILRPPRFKLEALLAEPYIRIRALLLGSRSFGSAFRQVCFPAH